MARHTSRWFPEVLGAIMVTQHDSALRYKGEKFTCSNPYSTLKTVGRSPVFSQAAIRVMCQLQEQTALLLKGKDGIKADHVGLSSQEEGLVTSPRGRHEGPKKWTRRQ